MRVILLLSALLLMSFYACEKQKKEQIENINNNVEPVKQLSFKVVNIFPHDSKAFTQGLFFSGDELFETTGLLTKSTLRKVEWSSGKVLEKINLPFAVFGEGSVELNGKIYVLTWQNGKCFVYDKKFKKIDEFTYSGEGWGLTTDGTNLFMSDGSPTIKVINPENFQLIKTLNITDDGFPLVNINELEYYNGFLLANIWTSYKVAVINLETGKVVSKIDFTELSTMLKNNPEAEVLNGIAYNKARNSFFLTGKNWNQLFEVKIDW